MRESSADRPRSASPVDVVPIPRSATPVDAAPIPRSRREARELAGAPAPQTRREARALVRANTRRAHRRSVSALLGRLSVPGLVTALAAAGVIGLPASVAGGTVPPQHSQIAGAGTWLPGAAAADAAREGVTASRFALPRATLSRGLNGAAAGKQAMTTRLTALDTSLAAGLQATEGARQRAREVATAQAFHEPILGAHQTSSFGWRWGRMHNGIDFGAGHGSPLYAVGSGLVTTTGWNSGLGYHVKVTLDTGELIVYGHLSRIGVSSGDRVTAGSLLGDVGSSGRSTGAHLHLEVRTQDGPIDPEPWLAARRP